MGTENVSLGEQEPENKTNNFRFCSLGRTAINWMMKCDRQGEMNNKLIKNEYILYSKC